MCLHVTIYIYGSGGIAPPILNLGTRWRRQISFMPLQFYPRGNTPRYPLYRRLGRPQSRSGCYGEYKNLLPLPGIESRLLCRPTPSLVTIATELPRFLDRHSHNWNCYRLYGDRKATSVFREEAYLFCLYLKLCDLDSCLTVLTDIKSELSQWWVTGI
jgi:hypothetical protein